MWGEIRIVGRWIPMRYTPKGFMLTFSNRISISLLLIATDCGEGVKIAANGLQMHCYSLVAATQVL